MNTITPQRISINRNSLKNNQGFSINQSSRNNVSFKASPVSIIQNADDLMTIFSKHYGNIGKRVGDKVTKLVNDPNDFGDILKKSSRMAIAEDGALHIKDKGVLRSIGENLIFPFVNLPLYGASWILKRVHAIAPDAAKEGIEKLYKKPLLRIPRKLNELDSKTNQLKGIFEKTDDIVRKFAKSKGIEREELIKLLTKKDVTDPSEIKLIDEANKYMKEEFYKVSNKFFDKHTGNFNTAYERPLNRIVTGLIPVAFLANDAYNLSVLCGDDKETSKKEAAERRSQEISRVFTTAYIQLLTFGAFAKQVNTLPWFTPLTSALTVLFSETSSRMRLGKPVFFLSKEKAKAHNEKNKAKEEGKEVAKDTVKQTENKKEVAQAVKTTTEQKTTEKTASATSYNMLVNNDSKVFTSFKASKPEENKQAEKKEERKALINFDTFKKAVTILVAGGFALSFLKNSSFTKNSGLMKAIRGVSDWCKENIYNKLAFKDFEISKTEFAKIKDCLQQKDKNTGVLTSSRIMEGHEYIARKFSKGDFDDAKVGMIKLYKGSVSQSKAKDIATEVMEQLAETTTIKAGDLTENLRIALGLEKTAISEMKYDKVAQKAIEIMKNKKLISEEESVDTLKELLTEAIKKNSKETAVQIDTKLRPFVDIVTQPFKFLASAAKLPFKIVTTLINMAVAPVEKKAAEALIGKAELNKFEKAVHRVIREIYGEKSGKEGKTCQVIFANAMEKLQKQTKPFRSAQDAYNIAVKSGDDIAIKKAEAALNKAKKDLTIYVNTAVEKSFDGVTQSSNKNTDLAMMSKLASSAVTSAFLVADNYNMVMLKSDGEDKEGAKEKANERIIQRLSALFYQTLFINWFNATFRSTYNSSLKGMAAVAIPNTITTELLTRSSIGMPIGRKTMEELEEIDRKNENRTGFAGKYFKFMRLLTGKKPLKDRLPKDKAGVKAPTTVATQTATNSQKTTSTNLLEMYIKK